MNPVVAALL